MRNYDDLEAEGVKFWPSEIAQQEKDKSIIPKLIETQGKFLSILNLSGTKPDSWMNILKASHGEMSANLFLKHLMVLSDIGGEKTKRFKTELRKILPDNKLVFSWNGDNYEYEFNTLFNKGDWGNTMLQVDGPSLSNAVELNDEITDIAMLILFGGNSIQQGIPEVILDRCVIGNLLGQEDELIDFVKERYIWVSRILAGATSNALGQIAENYVREYLKDKLPGWSFEKSTIPDISQNDNTDMSFDITAKSPTDKYIAIEVSFQVTTNSVIERKAGQAQARQQLLHEKGHFICYIIDGAGNFERKSACSTILKYSDCSVTFKDAEFDKLVEFIQNVG